MGKVCLTQYQHSRDSGCFNEAPRLCMGKGPFLYLFYYQIPARPRASASLLHPSHHSSDIPSYLKSPFSSITYCRASASRLSSTGPPLATPSTCHKNRITRQFPLQYPRKQPRLYLQQPPVTQPVPEDRMRYQRVHPPFICHQHRFPPLHCQ